MLGGFYCQDNEKVTIQDCLIQCRLGERCLTLPTLKLISREREWTGIASTTQLLQGTMEAWLKLTQPYCIYPKSRAFMLAGTWHHKALEDVAKELGLPNEVALSGNRDIFDLVEIEDGQLVLTDYKLWGSYHVAKALGITEMGKMPDPSGALYQKSGAWGKAGTPKMINKFEIIPDNADMWETELQLNNYRVKLKALGINIAKMQVQATVRDGGLAVATSRGVTENIYKIPVRMLPDNDVIEYFTGKDHDLQQALEHGWTEPCNSRESWDGRKCADYCDVWNWCSKGKLVRSIGGKGEE